MADLRRAPAFAADLTHVLIVSASPPGSTGPCVPPAGPEGILPKILQALASGDPLRNLEEKQAVCKQFADLLWFVMEFDELKASQQPRPAGASVAPRRWPRL